MLCFILSEFVCNKWEAEASLLAAALYNEQQPTDTWWQHVCGSLREDFIQKIPVYSVWDNKTVLLYAKQGQNDLMFELLMLVAKTKDL